MEDSVLSFLKAEWKVSDTGSTQCSASSFKFSTRLTAPNLICDEMVTLLVSSVVDRESRQTNDYKTPNLICDEMVTLLVSSVVDSESRQTNDYKIDIYCFSAKHSALRSKSTDW